MTYNKTTGICCFCNKYWFEVYRINVPGTSKSTLWKIVEHFTIEKGGKAIQEEVLKSWSNSVFCCLPCLVKLSEDKIRSAFKKHSKTFHTESFVKKFICTMISLLDKYENFSRLLHKDIIVKKKVKTKVRKG